jgi:hypothetical protein
MADRPVGDDFQLVVAMDDGSTLPGYRRSLADCRDRSAPSPTFIQPRVNNCNNPLMQYTWSHRFLMMFDVLYPRAPGSEAGGRRVLRSDIPSKVIVEIEPRPVDDDGEQNEHARATAPTRVGPPRHGKGGWQAASIEATNHACALLSPDFAVLRRAGRRVASPGPAPALPDPCNSRQQGNFDTDIANPPDRQTLHKRT